MGYNFHLSIAVICFIITTVLGQNCKCGPEDSCWPPRKQWDNLNSTVNGRLIKTVPIGAICRYSFENTSYYNPQGCAKLKATWNIVDPHLPSSSSTMQQLFANGSCDPFDAPTAPCRVDNYVSYTINVTRQSDVIAGLQFVRDYNIRLVIRNTGHDDLGRSIGHAALGIWLHYLTDIEYEPHYSSLGYQGPAVRVAAGVSSGGLIGELNKVGMVAVGGACPTVGVAGGHTPGGGHSILTSLHGLGADNTLEFEVITASGKTLTASPVQNPDLYWALSGGGSGNYGIVWTMTIKTFPDMRVAAASLRFNSTNHTSSQFWEAAKTWNSLAPNLTQAGTWSFASFVPMPGTQSRFAVDLVAPSLTVVQLHDLLAPLFQKLALLNFPFKYNTSSFDSYYDAYNTVLPVWEVGGLLGSRLIPRDTIEHSGDDLAAVQNMVLKMGFSVASMAFKASQPIGSNQDHAILPAWRESNIHMITGAWPRNGAKNYPLMVEQQANITNLVLPALQKLAPDSGAYMNEGDVFDPNWKVNFYGSNYNRLLQVKRKWDPENVLWVPVGVGSDALRENSKQVLCSS